MGVFARYKAKNWFEGRIQSALKNKKIAIMTILILLSGFFFYNQLISLFPHTFAKSYEVSGYLEHEREWFKVVSSATEKNTPPKEDSNVLVAKTNKVELIQEQVKKDDPIKNQLYQLVGNAPIKEMVPFIVKLDNQVGAFVIGIAKKESDWGRHAPSLGGKTCYNFWGYKGAGSRGTSMGYACFGSAEEAVSVVGKRIEILVNKNINNPQKFVVWKCGSSCAGHDPQGVKKWISDVSLYYGKVMKIKNT